MSVHAFLMSAYTSPDVFFPVATFDGATPPVRARLQADDWSSDEHGQKGETCSEFPADLAILSLSLGSPVNC